MGIASQSKADRRNLRKEIGEKAADAVAELRDVVVQAEMQQRVLAKQMLTFDIAIAAAKESDAVLRRRLDEIAEQLENVKARVAAEAANRENGDSIVGMQQRDYADHADRATLELVQTWLRMTFFGRLKWIVRGR